MGARSPPSFSAVTSTKVGIILQNFRAFSFPSLMFSFQLLAFITLVIRPPPSFSTVTSTKVGIILIHYQFFRCHFYKGQNYPYPLSVFPLSLLQRLELSLSIISFSAVTSTKAPSQFFHCHFYKGWNYPPKLLGFQFSLVNVQFLAFNLYQGYTWCQSQITELEPRVPH